MKISLFFFLTAILASPVDAQLVLHRTVTVNATLATPLNSKINHRGDRFFLLAENMRIEGHVENASRATPRHGATMDLLIDAVRFPHAAAAPMHARLHILSKTKSEVILKKGTPIRMKAIVDIAAPRAQSRLLAAPPTMRPYDDGEQMPF